MWWIIAHLHVVWRSRVPGAWCCDFCTLEPDCEDVRCSCSAEAKYNQQLWAEVVELMLGAGAWVGGMGWACVGGWEVGTDSCAGWRLGWRVGQA